MDRGLPLEGEWVPDKSWLLPLIAAAYVIVLVAAVLVVRLWLKF